MYENPKNLERRLRIAVKKARRSGDPLSLSNALANLAKYLLTVAKTDMAVLEEAYDVAQESLDLSSRHGSRNHIERAQRLSDRIDRLWF